jgi:hypothetical protein
MTIQAFIWNGLTGSKYMLRKGMVKSPSGANGAGLISLAQYLLTLAEKPVPTGAHIHMDASRELEDGSLDLVLERSL